MNKSWTHKTSKPLPVSLADILEARQRLLVLDYGMPSALCADDYVNNLLNKKGITSSVSNAYDTLSPNGSFKWRGAANFVLANPKNMQKTYGVSAGNHLQGVALIMDFVDRYGLKEEYGMSNTKMFIPNATPEVKVKSAQILSGGNIDITIADGDSFSDAKAEAEIWARQNNAIEIPTFDHKDIIAGQGTVGIEILEQLANASFEDPEFSIKLQKIIGEQGENLLLNVPCGGGGLVSGVAVVLYELAPEAKVVAVEPDYVASASKAIDEGRPIDVNMSYTDKEIAFATGVAIERFGVIPFEIVKQLGIEIVRVTAEEILESTYQLNLAGAEEGFNQTVEQAGSLGRAHMLNMLSDHVEGKVVVNLITGNKISLAEQQAISDRVRPPLPFKR